jgi:Bacterial Ig domain
MGRPLIVLLVCLFMLSLTCADTPTNLSIENSPPYVIQNISDLFIVGDIPTLNIIDIDDYFMDDNGDELNITHTPLQNITVTINSENQISFYPDIGYTGTQSMQFTVADLEGNVTGNIFNITVGEDTTAPQWANPAKNRATVYQNYYVNFTTVWQDNTELSYFVFSINQGLGWINLSAINFSGAINISRVRVQISAPSSTVVSWRYYASDMHDNINVTDIQSFTVSNYSYTGTSPPGTSSDTTTGYSIAEDEEGGLAISRTTGFKTDTQYIKASLRQGDTITKVVRITNIGDTQLEISASIKELQSFIMLNEKTFSLEAGETHEILVEFDIPKNAMPDQYFGTLVLESEESLSIPIILDIKKFESEISAKLFISEKYKTVVPEEEVVAKITIENLKDIRATPSNLYYAIKDFQGNILASGNKKIQLFAFFEEDLKLIVPKDAAQKEYIFYTRVTAEDQIDLDSDTFNVGYRFRILQFLKNAPYLLLVLLLLIIILILNEIRKRNKKKQRILELYLLLTELKSLVKKGKTTEAIDIYKRIKVVYGQRIPRSFQEDKEKLKVELDKFSKLLKQTPVKLAAPQQTQPTPGKPGVKPTQTTPPKITKPVTPILKKPETKTPAIPLSEPKETPTPKTSETKSLTTPAQKPTETPAPEKPKAKPPITLLPKIIEPIAPKPKETPTQKEPEIKIPLSPISKPKEKQVTKPTPKTEKKTNPKISIKSNSNKSK